MTRAIKKNANDKMGVLSVEWDNNLLVILLIEKNVVFKDDF